jgi:predicted DNA-binding transcriptional regulator AlpA
MNNDLLRIGEAAHELRVSIKTLDRAERDGRIAFLEGTCRRIRKIDLYRAYVLTLGQLAERLGIPYSTLLRAAKLKRFPVRRSVGVHGNPVGYRHASLAGVLLWSKQWHGRRRSRH